MGLCVVMPCLLAAVHYDNDRLSLAKLKGALAPNAHDAVEGLVTRYTPDSRDGRQPAILEVGDRRIEIHRFLDSRAFKETPSAGGADLSSKCILLKMTKETQEIIWLGVADPPCREASGRSDDPNSDNPR